MHSSWFLMLRFCLFLAVAMGSFPFIACAAGDQAASELSIVNAGGAQAEVLVDYFSADEVVENAAKAFVKEVHRRTGILLPIRQGSAQPGNVSIHIGNTDGDSSLNDALAKLGHKPVSSDAPGKEGYQIVSGRVDGLDILVVNGCDSLGAFHGVGRLLRKMRFVDGGASAPSDLNISSAPASWQRRFIFEANAGFANTTPDGWREIWTDYIFWGLSAISTSCDPAQQGDPRESDFSRYLWDTWTQAVDLTQSLGLDMVHVTQTNLVPKEGEFAPANIPDFPEINYMTCNSNGINPKFPRGMKVLEDSRRWFFENLPKAEKVDYIFSGWDTGGCRDPEIGPWSIKFAEIVGDMLYPMVTERNPDAKIILRLYFLPQIKELAEKLRDGWRPQGIEAFEFAWVQETDIAHLIPDDYKKVFLSMWCTDFFFYGGIGCNVRPKFCEENFREVRDRCGIRDGLGNYNEAVHEFVNQMILLQMSWDPSLSVDEILDDICNYYFGEEAGPILKEAFYLMEGEQPEILDDPILNPKVIELVAEAEKVLPDWARSSYHWGVIEGRAGVNRTRRIQADLLAQFDKYWSQYETLLTQDDKADKQLLAETRDYYQAVAENAWHLEDVYKKMDRNGFGVQGGNQIGPVWPDPRTGEVVEALEVLNEWPRKLAGLRVPSRTCVAFVEQSNQVCVSDGWCNFAGLSGPMAADAHLVIANLAGPGSQNEVVFLAANGLLYRWNPQETSATVLAKGDFLTGPLARGDLTSDGNEEVVVLVGSSAEDSRLAIVGANGDVRVLEAQPSGQAPDVSVKGIAPNMPDVQYTARIAIEPYIRVGDMDNDGKIEIAYADRAKQNHIRVIDSTGKLKWMGPQAPAGILTHGDLDEDGWPELVYLDEEGSLTACTMSVLRNGGTEITVRSDAAASFGETVKPKWTSSVTIAGLNEDKRPEVIFTGQDGYLHAIGLGAKSRRITNESNKTIIVGPGLVTGDFTGDGYDQVCCLRSRRWWDYPLSTLSVVGRNKGYRDIPVSTRQMLNLRYAAPMGPRACGQLSLPITHKSYQKHFGDLYKANWYNCGERDPIFESYHVSRARKRKEQ